MLQDVIATKVWDAPGIDFHGRFGGRIEEDFRVAARGDEQATAFRARPTRWKPPSAAA